MWTSCPTPNCGRTHERRRERLVNFARRRLTKQLGNRGATGAEIRRGQEVLDPEVLTIGFARRFATYKRATLLLQSPERLKRILLNPNKRVQLIIAGKAHPQDSQAKELIRQLIHFSRHPDVRNHIVFLEDYDINVARYMVQGVDCWLNTPRRPMEASGTSGMKAAVNGALNISIPDGWWCEAERLAANNGWSIGKGEDYESTEEQDTIESEALYELLEQEIVPAFYNRGSDGLPREWIANMKSAIRTICPVFNTYRMVQDYVEKCYVPCSERRFRMKADGRKGALELAQWKRRVSAAWPQVRVVNVESGPTDGLPVGARLQTIADVHLGELAPGDVTVEIFYGNLDGESQLTKGNA